MKVEFKELGSKEYGVLTSGLPGAHLTQQPFYGEWQEELGKKVFRYAIELGGKTIGFFQVIKYLMSLGKSYLYIPHGPIWINGVPEGVAGEFERFARELLARERGVFLRYDSPIEAGYRVPKFMYDGVFQPKYEGVLDLKQSEEDILTNMKKVNRYTVRQAEKFGVETEVLGKNFLQYLDKFYELVEETAEADGFTHNSREYYAKVFERCEAEGNGFMVIARWGGEVVLVNFYVTYGDESFFLFSGSGREKIKFGYTYLAQWVAIKYAKSLGLARYNFGAVIPDDNKYPKYRNWSGFSDFKRRFGGEILEYPDLRDIVYGKFWYLLYILKKIV